MTILIHKIQSYFKIRKLKKEIKRLEKYKSDIKGEMFKGMSCIYFISLETELLNINSKIEHKQSLINQLNK